jgi:predicted nucleic acid-binding Zn ribbon protein
MLKKAQPEHIGDILAQMTKTTSLGVNLEQAKIWEHWEQLVGAHLAKHSNPHSVKDGQLRIAVESAVWMHKLSYVKWDLLRRINLMAGKELISDVFFMLEKEEKEDEGT